MKKTLTIGAASAALAVTPMLGAFATPQTDTIQDTLSAKITSACVFTRYGQAGAASQVDTTTGDAAPAWSGATTAGAANTTTGIYSATFKPGNDVELGTSTFKGYCNDVGGFTVTVATPDLSTGGTNALTIPFAGTAPSATSGEGWTLTKSDASLITATGDTFIDGTSGPTSSSTAITETATYKVYTKSDTKAGTYTGDVIYTFTYNDPTAS